MTITEKQIRMAREAGIHFPTVKPLFSIPPDPKVLGAWLARQNVPKIPESYSIAQKIVENINHISFDLFMVQLHRTIAEFNRVCDEPYALWISQDTLGKVNQGCSEQWVAGLALEDCGLRWPEFIFTTTNMPCKDGYDGVKSILILDDASYSGNHLQRELQGKADVLPENCTLYLGIPFQTEQSTKQENIDYSLLEMTEKRSHTITVVNLIHGTLPILNDFLTEQERAVVQRGVFSWCQSGDQTLTYLDHKTPDYQSMLLLLEFGYNLLDTTDYLKFVHGVSIDDYKRRNDPAGWNAKCAEVESEYVPLVPAMISPYKLHRSSERERLAELLKSRKGLTQIHPLPERYNEAQAVLDEHGIVSPAPAPAPAPAPVLAPAPIAAPVLPASKLTESDAKSLFYKKYSERLNSDRKRWFGIYGLFAKSNVDGPYPKFSMLIDHALGADNNGSGHRSRDVMRELGWIDEDDNVRIKLAY